MEIVPWIETRRRVYQNYLVVYAAWDETTVGLLPQPEPT